MGVSGSAVGVVGSATVSWAAGGGGGGRGEEEEGEKKGGGLLALLFNLCTRAQTSFHYQFHTVKSTNLSR